MAKQTLESKEILHASNERVKELEIVIKGSFVATMGDVVIELPYGSMIGLLEQPGEMYRFDYVAKEDAVVVSYSYKNPASIQTIIKSNPQIVPYITTSVLSCIQDLFEKVAQNMQACRELIDILGTGEKLTYDLQVWKFGFFRSVGDMLPSKDPGLCNGFVLYGYEYIQFLSFILSELIEKKREYDIRKEELNGGDSKNEEGTDTNESASEDPADDVDESEAVNELMHTDESGDGTEKEKDDKKKGDVKPSDVSDSLIEILEYSGVDNEKAEAFEKLIADYTSMPDRNDTSDKGRNLRRQLSEVFYEVYEGAFMRSLMDRDIPVVLKMFFYFGFVTPELAGEDNTRELHMLAESYKPDPEGNVLTAYEWLKLIYEGKAEPSKNEFDMEYPKYLKQRYENGEIKQTEIKRLLADQKAKVSFELNNFLKTGARITFGRVSSFVPVFTKDSVVKKPGEAMASWKKIHEALDTVRRIDFGCFTRQMVFSNTNIGVTREFIDVEILPYIILMPNGGSRSTLWQEISGAYRDTPGRMMMPVFTEKDVSNYIIRLSGEFRWEMCRREQGVHWNDVTVPSLTSLFSDYMQFYRKNHDLSPELREKIKNQLQAARNSVKAVFVSDYINYLAYESAGSLRLNKVSREILFRFCPFASDIRAKLAKTSPAYQKLIERFDIKRAQKKHMMGIVFNKIEKEGADIPEELLQQQAYIDK
ncbi:MAG: hypothetical protein K6G03_09770 [Lachnospiraceae bacterium]|nr:hypothetical protein [Lachnospiraceae bacterium]